MKTQLIDTIDANNSVLRMLYEFADLVENRHSDNVKQLIVKITVSNLMVKEAALKSLLIEAI